MMGLEGMLSSMLGVSPDEMKAMFTQLATAATNGAEGLTRIEAKVDSAFLDLSSHMADGLKIINEKQDKILAILEGLERVE